MNVKMQKTSFSLENAPLHHVKKDKKQWYV